MSVKLKHEGVVGRRVRPVTKDGHIDEPAVDTLVEFLLAGGVEGIFVLGTTGEGMSVPAASRRRLVERTVAAVKGRSKVYAGIGDNPRNAVAVGNEYFHAGADAVVTRPPVSFPVEELLPWFNSLLAGLERPLILYNIPPMTNVSIPLDVSGHLLRHPKIPAAKAPMNN